MSVQDRDSWTMFAGFAAILSARRGTAHGRTDLERYTRLVCMLTWEWRMRGGCGLCCRLPSYRGQECYMLRGGTGAIRTNVATWLILKIRYCSRLKQGFKCPRLVDPHGSHTARGVRALIHLHMSGPDQRHHNNAAGGTCGARAGESPAAMWLLTSFAQQHVLRSCATVVIVDMSGGIITIYGRRPAVSSPSASLPLFAADSHTGVWLADSE